MKKYHLVKQSEPNDQIKRAEKFGIFFIYCKFLTKLKAIICAKNVKYIQIIAICLIVLTCLLSFIFATQRAHAQTFPTETVTIAKNPITKHMYFAPTYPRCITAPIVAVKFVNATNSRATIQTDNGSIISVPPHATKYGYFDGYYIWVVWKMLESNQYGGDAWIYFNSCE